MTTGDELEAEIKQELFGRFNKVADAAPVPTKIVRTYPPLHPETLRGRNRIEDETQRAYIREYDNRPLAAFKANLIILEWDIAVSREDLELFCEIATSEPDRIMVAPYRLYPPTDDRLPATGVWAHRVVTNQAQVTTRWVLQNDPTCDLFSLGMAYVPQAMIDSFIAHPGYHMADERMTDANFALWHYRQVKEKVPICWPIRPVHLHYDIPKEYPWT